MDLYEIKKTIIKCNNIDEVEKIRNEINSKINTKIKTFYTRIKTFHDEINSINIFAEQHIRKILNNIESKNNINTITQFLYEIVYPGEEEIIKSNILYDSYKNWCKDESNAKPYGKNKFYEMLKLEPRVEHKHLAMGDYFKFELNIKSIDTNFEMPF